MATLTLAHGRNARAHRAEMIDRCHAGQAWKNANGTLTGSPGSAWMTGRLPAEYRDAAQHAVYVIHSYATPIAWQTADGEWIVPDVSYSSTTSRHQSLARSV